MVPTLALVRGTREADQQLRGRVEKGIEYYSTRHHQPKFSSPTQSLQNSEVIYIKQMEEDV